MQSHWSVLALKIIENSSIDELHEVKCVKTAVLLIFLTLNVNLFPFLNEIP